MTELEALQTLATSPRFVAGVAAVVFVAGRRQAIAAGLKRAVERLRSLPRTGHFRWREHLLPLAIFGYAAVLLVGQRGCNVTIPWPLPIPIPAVAPIDAPGLNVLIVEETEDREKLNQAQANLMDSLAWREYVESKGGDWQLLDDDVTGEAEKWQKALQRPRTASPWLIVSNGKTGEEGPLPATLEELMALLRKYGD